MKRFEEFGHRDTRMASVETCINKTQWPTIMVNMEFALLSMVKKSLNIGHAITKSCLQKMARDLFKRLRGLQLYEESAPKFTNQKISLLGFPAYKPLKILKIIIPLKQIFFSSPYIIYIIFMGYRGLKCISYSIKLQINSNS